MFRELFLHVPLPARCLPLHRLGARSSSLPVSHFQPILPFSFRRHYSSHARCAQSTGGCQKKLSNQQRQKIKAKSRTSLCRGCGAPREGRHVFEHHRYISDDLKAPFPRAVHQRWCLRRRLAGHILLGAGAWENPRGAHQN